jgi:hypothetical protein
MPKPVRTTGVTSLISILKKKEGGLTSVHWLFACQSSERAKWQQLKPLTHLESLKEWHHNVKQPVWLIYSLNCLETLPMLKPTLSTDEWLPTRKTTAVKTLITSFIKNLPGLRHVFNILRGLILLLLASTLGLVILSPVLKKREEVK